MANDNVEATRHNPPNEVIVRTDRESVVRAIAAGLSSESSGTLVALSDGTLQYNEKSLDAVYAGYTTMWCVAAAVAALLIAQHRPFTSWWLAGFIAVLVAFTLPLFFLVLWQRTTSTVIALDDVEGGTKVAVLTDEPPRGALRRTLNSVARDFA